VKRLAVPVFAHRVVINTRNTLVERRLDAGERIIEQILTQVEVPL
jgi:MoxR-like ATPase